MTHIQILPEILANKIAAGEVIERPASIVKELVENALDAGADAIDITVQHGGKSLIRVADNGLGMAPDDLQLAVQRHATSKILNDEDLDNIRSYGFRGEALPSIAAVSRLRMVTRTADNQEGAALAIEGGKGGKTQTASTRVGTIVEVRDLFFNTPARRKFMRAEKTESRHVADVVGQLALAAPQVRFTLQSGSKTVLNFSAGEALARRAQTVLSVEEVTDLLPVAADAPGVRISALIGKPQCARANRGGQLIYVNRRAVKSIPISYALLDGYHGLLMHGQYPVGVLFIDVDPERVDVNVHPTKQEVRLSQETAIKGLIRQAVADRLRQEEDLAPHLVTKGPPILSGQETPSGEPSGTQWQPLGLRSIPQGSAEQVLVEPIAMRNKLKLTKILGQIHNTYIAAETETGFMLVDQHAAHERVMFEELMSDIESGVPRKQGLLLNEVLALKPGQEEMLTRARPMLERMGFEIDGFGSGDVVIRAVPATLQHTDPVQCLRHFIEQRESDGGRSDLEDHAYNVAALIACKRKSVKASDTLTPEKVQRLLERLARCDNPFHCPHGRPAFFQSSLDDLEKQFKRKV